VAPQDSKKSLWIEVKRRYISANILTKFLPCAAYLRERDVLFNVV
jgi:hypothetical protein